MIGLLIELGNSIIATIIATVPIIVSVVALLISWNKDRQLKKKEYADRIRNAAGDVAAKLERRKELFLSFFDGIQPLITDTDIKLAKTQNVIATRDFLWRELVSAQAKYLERISDEQIEVAYKDLYGYDPRIQELYVRAIVGLKRIDRVVSTRLLYGTQGIVLNLSESKKPYLSAQLGNALRISCSSIALEAENLIDGIITPFRNQIIGLIGAKDSEIVNRQVNINTPDKLFAEVDRLISQYESVGNNSSGVSSSLLEDWSKIISIILSTNTLPGQARVAMLEPEGVPRRTSGHFLKPDIRRVGPWCQLITSETLDETLMDRVIDSNVLKPKTDVGFRTVQCALPRYTGIDMEILMDKLMHSNFAPPNQEIKTSSKRRNAHKQTKSSSARRSGKRKRSKRGQNYDPCHTPCM